MLQAFVKKRAQEIGFDLVGIAPVDAPAELKFSREWLERGYAGEMEYLRNPKRDDLHLVLPSAQSVICVGLIYNAPFPYSTEMGNRELGLGKSGIERSGDRAIERLKEVEIPIHPIAQSPNHSIPRGWISRYAWGSDYHEMMRAKLEELRLAVEALAPGVETRVYVDTGPIVERAFARLSGIGWTGKNTCLINQERGSWFFLGVLLTSLALSADLPAPDRCGSCTACIDACPTEALVEPYVMDASRCIAYFTIELKGAIPEGFRTAIGNNVVGCDICQDVCPWNGGRSQKSEVRSQKVQVRRKGGTTNLAEFQPMQINMISECATGELRTPNSELRGFSLFNPPLKSLANLTEEEFRQTFKDSPIKRVKYRGWLRNVCVAMGNSGDPTLLPTLRALLENPDPIVREHAEWAIAQITENHLSASETRTPGAAEKSPS